MCIFSLFLNVCFLGFGPGSVTDGSTPVLKVLIVLAERLPVQPALGLHTCVLHYASLATWTPTELRRIRRERLCDKGTHTLEVVGRPYKRWTNIAVAATRPLQT